MKSKFFKKRPLEDTVSSPELDDLDTDDVQGELQATLGGVFNNVESGVGGELTEVDTDENEASLTTEAATSESAPAKEAAPATTVESAVTALPEISEPESAPATVVAAEGTTGVEAKLDEPTPASDS